MYRILLQMKKHYFTITCNLPTCTMRGRPNSGQHITQILPEVYAVHVKSETE